MSNKIASQLYKVNNTHISVQKRQFLFSAAFLTLALGVFFVAVPALAGPSPSQARQLEAFEVYFPNGEPVADYPVDPLENLSPEARALIANAPPNSAIGFNLVTGEVSVHLVYPASCDGDYPASCHGFDPLPIPELPPKDKPASPNNWSALYPDDHTASYFAASYVKAQPAPYPEDHPSSYFECAPASSPL